MEFSRISDDTVKCIISEEEIESLGYTLDEIMSNGERTQEFMNHIFDLAEQKFNMKFDLGVKTVRADFMPDHTLALTFSQHKGNAMMEHLKDIVNEVIESIPQDKLKKVKEETEAEEQLTKIVAIFTFENMDIIMHFSKLVTNSKLPWNALYRLENQYYLIIDLSECTEKEVLHFSVLTDEYAKDISVGLERKAFIEEHGEVLLPNHAIEFLQNI